MAKQEQEALPGIPQPPKRKVIAALEDLCLKRDKLAGKRTALSDQVAEIGAEIQAKLVEQKLELYTYEDDSGVLQDVNLEAALKKRKSKLNPKKKKGEE